MNSFDYLDKGADRTERDASGDEVFSVPVKAGKRIYYFDVKATRADDYYVTITESRKRLNRDGSTTIDKHKIHLYKEDFEKFAEGLQEVFAFIRTNKPDDFDASGAYINPNVTFAAGGSGDSTFSTSSSSALSAATASSGHSYLSDSSNFDSTYGTVTDASDDSLTPRVPTEEEFFGNL